MGLRDWFQSEKRSDSYTDTITRIMYQSAAGADISLATACAEAITGIYGRGLSIGEFTGVPGMYSRVLNAPFLALVGREFIRRGEAVFAIEITGSGLSLVPASGWDVSGFDNEWVYRCDFSHPSGQKTRAIPAAGVLHFRINSSPASPWRGRSPLRNSGLSHNLLTEMERRLLESSQAERGSVIPFQDTKSPEVLNMLDTALKARAKGSVFLPVSSNWDPNSRTESWEWRRLHYGGMNQEDYEAKDLRGGIEESLYSAAGVPLALVTPGSPGPAIRESERIFISQTLKPVAELIATEVREKLELPDAVLSLEKLTETDIVARARALNSMVQAGCELADALEKTGLA